MVTIDGIEKQLKLHGTYCRERCYKAADRAVFMMYQEIITSIAKEKSWDDSKVTKYQLICQAVSDL